MEIKIAKQDLLPKIGKLLDEQLQAGFSVTIDDGFAHWQKPIQNSIDKQAILSKLCSSKNEMLCFYKRNRNQSIDDCHILLRHKENCIVVECDLVLYPNLEQPLKLASFLS